MNEGNFARRFSKWLVRTVLFASALVLFQAVRVTLIGGGLSVNLLWSFVGDILIAFVLAWVISKTRLRRLDLTGLIWLALFVVQQFNNTLEALFFTILYSSTPYLVQSLLTSVVTTLVEAVLAAVLFTPTKHETKLTYELSSYFRKRARSSWAWRIVVGSLAYFPIYLFFGMLITPFVLPYYASPSAGLRIPSFTVLIPLEFLRGFLYVASLLGVFAAARASRKTVSLVTACILYVPGALVPLLLATTASALPPAIVPYHLTEILADSLVYGAVLARLFRASM